MFKDFIKLIFPNHCIICDASLIRSEDIICSVCKYQLPKTNSHLGHNNKAAKLLWGRAPISDGHAFYQFEKGNKVQKIIYQLKYKGVKEVAELIGEWMGTEYANSNLFDEIDLIVPIPLHPIKKRIRGYNQCDYFAKGLSTSLNKKADLQSLIRTSHQASQTNKTRFDRWNNATDSFKINSPKRFKSQHILIVDDVITTGSTLEAACNAILEIGDTKVSFATIAVAN